MEKKNICSIIDSINIQEHKPLYIGTAYAIVTYGMDPYYGSSILPMRVRAYGHRKINKDYKKDPSTRRCASTFRNIEKPIGIGRFHFYIVYF